jgi:hypothetical protein
MLVMDQPTRKVRKSENNQIPSHLQLAQVGHARPHLFQVHLHEVVFHATSFSGGENFLPVQRALTYSDNLSRVRIPALHVHGDEPARIFPGGANISFGQAEHVPRTGISPRLSVTTK